MAEMTDAEMAAWEAEMALESDDDDGGATNKAGVSYATLWSEEKKLHSAQNIVTFESVQAELDDVIPNLRKDGNFYQAQDFADELDDKVFMLKSRIALLEGQIAKDKFDPVAYLAEAEANLKLHCSMVQNADRKDLKERLMARAKLIAEGVKTTREQCKAQGIKVPGPAPAPAQAKPAPKKTADAVKGKNPTPAPKKAGPTESDLKAMEAELDGLSDDDDDGPTNKAGVSYAKLWQEEKKLHSAQQIVTFESVQAELDDVIPKLRADVNFSKAEDFADELDDKVFMLKSRIALLEGQIAKDKFDPVAYLAEAEANLKLHQQMVAKADRKDLKDRLMARAKLIAEGVKTTREQLKAQGIEAPAPGKTTEAPKGNNATKGKGDSKAADEPKKPKSSVKKLTSDEIEKLTRRIKVKAQEYKLFAEWLHTFNSPARSTETNEIISNYKACALMIQDVKNGKDPGVEKFISEKFPTITSTTVLGMSAQEKQTQIKSLNKKIDKLIDTLHHYKAQKDTAAPLKMAKQLQLWLEKISDNEWAPIPRIEISQLKVRCKEENSGFKDEEFRLKIKGIDGHPTHRTWFVEWNFGYEGYKNKGQTEYCEKHGAINYSKTMMLSKSVDKHFVEGATLKFILHKKKWGFFVNEAGSVSIPFDCFN
jgi:hypothetical protein